MAAPAEEETGRASIQASRRPRDGWLLPTTTEGQLDTRRHLRGSTALSFLRPVVRLYVGSFCERETRFHRARSRPREAVISILRC